MAVVFDDIGRLSRLLFVFKSIGDVFIRMLGISSVIEKFVWRKSATEESHQTDCIHEKDVSSSFVAETENLFHFHPSLLKSDRELFRDFHDFSLQCGKPIATVLSSLRTICRKCGKKLAYENKVIPVVIYSNHRGTYLGSRLTKVCRKCKIYEHHGYWSADGERHFNRDSLSLEFLVSSEDTAFEMDVLAEFSNLLVIGAVPFSTYASSYNRRFQYCKVATSNNVVARVKRMKRYGDTVIVYVIFIEGISMERYIYVYYYALINFKPARGTELDVLC